MTTKIVTRMLLLLCLAAISCRKKPAVEPPENGGTPGPWKPTRNDQIVFIKDMFREPAGLSHVKDSIWKDSAGISISYKYQAAWFRANNENAAQVYPGAFLDIADFRRNQVTILKDYPNHDIHVYSSNPRFLAGKMVNAQKSAIDELINKWFGKVPENEPRSIYVFSTGKFNYYAPSFLTFPGGSDLLNHQLPAIDQFIPKRTTERQIFGLKAGVLISDASINHVAKFNYQFDARQNESYYRTHLADKSGFISEVAYGHLVYIFLESDKPHQAVIDAATRFFKDQATADDVNLLKLTDATVYYQHTGATAVSPEKLNGYERLKEYQDIVQKKPLVYKGVPLFYDVFEIKNLPDGQMSAGKVLRDEVYKTDHLLPADPLSTPSGK